MPITYRIAEEYGVVLFSCAGLISDSDQLLSCQELYNDEKWKPGFHEVVDLRNSNLSGITNDGLHELSLLSKQYTEGKCEGFKTAIIAPEVIPSAIATFYSVLADGVGSPEHVNIFTELSLSISL